jgi:hypothetical protein
MLSILVGRKNLPLGELEKIAVGIWTRDTVQSYPGSISIKSSARVEAKIVPQKLGEKSLVLLGVRPEWPVDNWSGLEPRGYKIMDQGFQFVQLSAEPADAVAIAQAVLIQLRDVLAQQTEAD